MSIDLKRLPGGAVLLITLIAPGVLAHQADRFLLSPIALRSRPLIDAEPQTGPMPPCGMEPIPAYPDVNEQSVVKSWSKSDLGRDWKPPVCTGPAFSAFVSSKHSISARATRFKPALCGYTPNGDARPDAVNERRTALPQLAQ